MAPLANLISFQSSHRLLYSFFYSIRLTYLWSFHMQTFLVEATNLLLSTQAVKKVQDDSNSS